MYCPSCFLDCGKRAGSAGDGTLSIEGLDPTLLFNLMTVADGFVAEESGMLDPGAGTVTIELEARAPLPDEPGHVVRGRVLDASGAPVAQAVVEPRMFYFPPAGRDRGISGSSRVEGADPLSITDGEGWFSIGSPTRIQSLEVRVAARALATALVGGLVPDDPAQSITLGEGVTVSGRLFDASGSALAGYGVGMCQTNRTWDVFVGFFEIDTNEHGEFSFVNMPPNQECILYTKMRSVSALGAAAPVVITTGEDGSAVEGVELRLGQGHTLRGRVVLADGKPIPEGQGVMLVSGNTMWDSAPEHVLPADGAFEFVNLPTESYTISVRIPGYSVSPKNPNCLSFDGRIEGRIEQDLDGFVILMQQGAFQPARPPNPAEMPLRGYEDPPAKP